MYYHGRWPEGVELLEADEAEKLREEVSRSADVKV